jgi:stage III sporulation protein AD
MNEIFIIIVLGVVSSFLIIFIKKYSPEFAVIASICAGCIILLFLVNEFVSIKKYVEKWQNYSGVSAEWIRTIVKISIICFVGQWGIQLCRDSGENSIADKLETAIKVIVIIICFPYIDMLFDFAFKIE